MSTSEPQTSECKTAEWPKNGTSENNGTLGSPTFTQVASHESDVMNKVNPIATRRLRGGAVA
jgi:hypothetical protein